MTDAAGNLLFALVATPLAMYVIRDAWPIRRLEGERRIDMYWRLYWDPANAVVVAGVFWLGVIGRGPFAHAGGWGPLLAIGWVLFITAASAARRIGREQRANQH